MTRVPSVTSTLVHVMQTGTTSPTAKGTDVTLRTVEGKPAHSLLSELLLLVPVLLCIPGQRSLSAQLLLAKCRGDCWPLREWGSICQHRRVRSDRTGGGSVEELARVAGSGI